MKEIIRQLGEYINSHNDKLTKNLYYILALLYYGN